MFTYENKTAIVTGAGSGIGQAISKELIARGAKVWLADIDEKGVRSASAELGIGGEMHELGVEHFDRILADCYQPLLWFPIQ